MTSGQSATAAPKPGVLGEWLRGWPAVVACIVGMGVAYIHTYTTGFFIGPVEAEYGWSRSQITLGLTIVSVMSVVLAPFGGALVDRFGVRAVGAPGLAVYCAAIVGLSFTGPSVWSWWAVWVLVGFGSVCLKPTLWTMAVSERFDAGRGFALALALCGTGIAAAVLPLLTEAGGWRFAYRALGGVGGLLALTLMLVVFRRSAAASATPAAKKAATPKGETRAAFLSPVFLKLCGASGFKSFAASGLLVHFAPIVAEEGLSRGTAAAAASLIGVSAIVGRLAAGFLLDRVNAKLVGAVAFAIPVVACLCFLLAPGSAPAITVAAVAIGLALGSTTGVVAYSATRVFNPATTGLLLGSIFGVMSLSSGLSALAYSMVFDITGAYRLALIGAIPLILVASGLLASLGHVPRQAAARPG